MAGAPTLLVSALLAAVSAGIYAYVGRVIARRHVEAEAKLAVHLFATFWFALAAATALGALTTVLGWAGITDVSVYVTQLQVSFLITWIALWGLLYYLAYLYTGRRSLLIPISAFYLAFYAYTVYLIVVADPTGVTVDEWRVSIEYAEQPSAMATLAFLIGLIVPPLLGAIAYARLFFKVDARTQRYRIGLVSGTIVAWFGSLLLASILQVGDSLWWQLTSRGISVAAALLVYFAYRPPAWVQSRYGIEAAEERPA